MWSNMDAIPTDLRSPRAKLVYLYLRNSGGATVEQLARALDMQKIALFSVLKTLRQRGLVDRDREQYVLV